MILTGHEIESQIKFGAITIDPFLPENVGANSVDLRLADELLVYDLNTGHLDCKIPPKTKPVKKRPDGSYLLRPNILYLGRTVERIGSDKFVPLVEGRSSIGRLGVQVHMTAGVGDLGFLGTITLEIAVIHPIKIYPLDRVAQVLFVESKGKPCFYQGRYQNQTDVTPSRMSLAGFEPRGER